MRSIVLAVAALSGVFSASAGTLNLRVSDRDGKLAAEGKGATASQADVKFESSGMLGLGCHLHGSMRGHVLIADTPWYARTDANGEARIDGVPDGAAEVRLWHPDQLTEQMSKPVQRGAAPTAIEAQLNFTPRRRHRS